MAVKQSNTTTGIRNITIAHATVQALHMLKEDASGSSRTVRSAKQCSTRIVQRKSTRDQPWIWQAAWQAPWDPVRQFWKWSDDDFSNHWQSLTYNTLMFRWYSSRFALRFKKVTPSHHILSSHFTKGRFLCENNEIARKKEQVPDFRLEGRWSTAVPFGLWKCIVSFLWTCWKTHHRPISILGLGWSSSVWPFSVFKMPNWILSLSHCQEQFIVTVISVWKHPQSQLSPIKMLLLQRLS